MVRAVSGCLSSTVVTMPAIRTVILLVAISSALFPVVTLSKPNYKDTSPPPVKATTACAGGKKSCKPAMPKPTPPKPPSPVPPLPPVGNRPNFVVIITDDQDEVLNSTHPAFMPALDSLLGKRGTRFANTIASTSVCCPARVSLLTGRLAHCSNVTGNWMPAGAWSKFSKLGLDADWLPGWLKEVGYRTILLGKLLNGFMTPLGPKSRCPLGVDYLDTLTNGTYSFYDSMFSLNCGPSVSSRGRYQTDVIRDKALSYIDGAVDAHTPFYLQVTPAAPHFDNSGQGWQPPPPAARHANLYLGMQLPANPTLLKPNPLNPSKQLDMTKPDNVKAMTELYVGRLRALRAVDEMIEAIVTKLADRGVLNNTYIIYASDNGLHMGQHSLASGKAGPLEEESRVPLYIAGPGVPAGVISPYQANLVDLPATVRVLAGLGMRRDLDGLPLPMKGLTTEAYGKCMQRAVAAAAKRAGITSPAPPPSPMSASLVAPRPRSPQPPQPTTVWLREGILLEAWDSDAKNWFFPGITFKGLRLCSTVALNFTAAMQQARPNRPPALMVPNSGRMYCLKYIVWCKGNQRELYDLSSDPYETTNVLSSAPGPLLKRLDAMLSVLVHCRGLDCAHPWGALHPDGGVLSFKQAMDPRYDALYAALPRFAFVTCYPLYVPANERTFTLGMEGFPANTSWASTGIAWPLPNGARGLSAK